MQVTAIATQEPAWVPGKFLLLAAPRKQKREGRRELHLVVELLHLSRYMGLKSDEVVNDDMTCVCIGLFKEPYTPKVLVRSVKDIVMLCKYFSTTAFILHFMVLLSI